MIFLFCVHWVAGGVVGAPMDYSYLLKYEISKQLYSSEDSFLSPCRSEHSVGSYQPATSLKTLVFCPNRTILQLCNSGKAMFKYINLIEHLTPKFSCYPSQIPNK